MKVLALIGGFIGVLLGGLWLLQGLGFVHVPPILCFADCAAIQGPSLVWVVIGGLMVGVGALAVLFSLIRHDRR